MHHCCQLEIVCFVMELSAGPDLVMSVDDSCMNNYHPTCLIGLSDNIFTCKQIQYTLLSPLNTHFFLAICCNLHLFGVAFGHHLHKAFKALWHFFHNHLGDPSIGNDKCFIVSCPFIQPIWHPNTTFKNAAPLCNP